MQAELKESQKIVLDVSHLSLDYNKNEGYYNYGEKIWQAFNLGRQYEAFLTQENLLQELNEKEEKLKKELSGYKQTLSVDKKLDKENQSSVAAIVLGEENN